MNEFLSQKDTRKGSSVVRFLRAEPMVNDSNPISARTTTSSEESHQFSVIQGLGLTRCGHIEMKDLDAAQKAKSFSVSKCLHLTSS